MRTPATRVATSESLTLVSIGQNSKLTRVWQFVRTVRLCAASVPMFPAIACNLENPAFMHNARVRLYRESVCAWIIIAVVVASREDPHPGITGIVPASTSHRSTALNAASSCNDDDDEADAHSRHSTHLDRRTHCLQLHMSYSASNPKRSIISNLSRAEILIFSAQLSPHRTLFEHVVTSINDKATLSIILFFSVLLFINVIYIYIYSQ